MLDFAKSIMTGNARTIVGQVGSAKIYYDTEEDEYYTDCGGSIYDNPGFKTKNDAVNYIVKKNKTGNAGGIKEFNTEADLRRWCIEHQYTYTPTHGGYYRLEDDKPGRNRPDLEAHVKAGNKKVGNAEYDIVYQGHALSDAEIEKIKKDPASKSKLIAEYKDMVKQGVISLAEFNAMQREIGNSKVGNYSADAFLSNAKSFAKEWSAKADGYAKAGDKQGLETLMRSAEAKYDEIKKYQDNAYQAYKDASSVADDYRALGNKISKLLK